MKSRWPILVMLLATSCATTPATEEGFEAHYPEEDRPFALGDDEEAPGDEHASARLASKEGEPIYSTSLAISLAELALQSEGVKYEERGVTVSYYEGIYTVVFEHPPAEAATPDFKVDIDAKTSKILKIQTKPE